MSYSKHSKPRSNHSRSLLCALIPLLSLTGIACSGVDPGEEATRSSAQHLWLSGVKWTNGIVPVCWDPATTTRSDFALRSRQVRDIANDSWPRVANVEFTGWGTCPANTAGMVRIELDDSGSANAGGIGFTSAGLVMSLGTGRSDFTGSMVPHEFGHVLGFAHEMARADFVDDPATGCQEGNVPGDAVNTPADMQSIMASTGYCQENSTLSLWDVVGVQKAYGARSDAARPLVIGWNSTRADNATVSTASGVSDLNSSGYAWKFAEGWVFNDNIPGTTALNLYWNPTRQDNFTAASATSQSSALASGYTLVRTEGYVFTSQQPGTVPLKSYWNAVRQDNITVASATAEQAAISAGYTFVRTEGYIPASTPYALGWAYWSDGRFDNLLTAGNSTLAANANDAGYTFTGFDGAFWVNNYPGTTALQTYWSAALTDHFETATTAGISSAVASGYTLIGTEGYVYTSSTTGMSPMKSYFSSSRNDNFTTIERGGVATSSGYTLTRTEGYGVPIND